MKSPDHSRPAITQFEVKPANKAPFAMQVGRVEVSGRELLVANAHPGERVHPLGLVRVRHTEGRTNLEGIRFAADGLEPLGIEDEKRLTVAALSFVALREVTSPGNLQGHLVTARNVDEADLEHYKSALGMRYVRRFGDSAAETTLGLAQRGILSTFKRTNTTYIPWPSGNLLGSIGVDKWYEREL